MAIQDADVVKAIIAFGNLPEDATFEALGKYVEDLLRQMRSTFPGLADEQFLRCQQQAIYHRAGL